MHLVLPIPAPGNTGARKFLDPCTSCGKYDHAPSTCFKTHPELRAQFHERMLQRRRAAGNDSPPSPFPIGGITSPSPV